MKIPENGLKRPIVRAAENSSKVADPDQLYRGAAQSQWDSNSSTMGVKADRRGDDPRKKRLKVKHCAR
jgi:hypothetical protein